MRTFPSRPPRAVLAASGAIAAIAAIAALANACAPRVETPREVASYTIEQFMDTTRLWGLQFSPDGTRLLVSSDRTGVFNASEYPVDGGEPVRLTDSTDSAITILDYFPDGERILYTADTDGDEIRHLWVRNADGSVRNLTPTEGVRAFFAGWADDDRSFYYRTNARDPRTTDLYQMDVDDYESREIWRNESGFEFDGISPDGRIIALTETRSTGDSDVHLVDLETGEITLVTEHEGQALHLPVAFTPDDRALLLMTDADSDFMHVVRHDLATGEKTRLLEADWDIRFVQYSEDGRFLIASINRDARTEVRLYDARTMERLPLPELPDAEINTLKISDDGRRIAFYASSSHSPQDLYVAELGGPDDAAASAPRRLSSALSPEIDRDDLVDGEVVRFASYDGLEIPGILYRPHQASAEHPVPAVIWIHGGPGGQSRLGYSDLTQYLVNGGYAVYAINHRGSGGYGKRFSHLDDKRHGEADLDDVVASKAMLAATGWIDPDRIAVAGASYGGYLTLAALTFHPTEFAAGIDLYGISNWPRVIEAIPPWWESMRDAILDEMGDPAEDGERLRRISPLFSADRIERPLLVLQGANDPRVLPAESEDIVAAVRANGVPVEYLLFEDEGHGFAKKENRAEAYATMREFLDRYVGGGGENVSDEASEDEMARTTPQVALTSLRL